MKKKIFFLVNVYVAYLKLELAAKLLWEAGLVKEAKGCGIDALIQRKRFNGTDTFKIEKPTMRFWQRTLMTHSILAPPPFSQVSGSASHGSFVFSVPEGHDMKEEKYFPFEPCT